MSDRSHALLARVSSAPVFAGLAPEDLARLLDAATPTGVADGQTVFTRGDVASGVYLILAGAIRISTLAASGKRVTVEIFQRNELFGDIAAIDQGLRTADAAALGRSELLHVPLAPFREVLARCAPLANNLLRQTIARLRRTYSLLEDASLRAIEPRLAKQLLYLLKLGTVGEDAVRLRVRMHQDELADLLGVTTRSIINVLNKWRADELVAFDGRTAQVTILDMDRFRAITED